MIYLKFNKAAMKIKSQTVRVAFWVLLGVAISFTSLALSHPIQLVQEATATPTLLTAATIVATVETRADVGSTDGIMLMGVVILLIVIIPILIRRQTWSNGKRKK